MMRILCLAAALAAPAATPAFSQAPAPAPAEAATEQPAVERPPGPAPQRGRAPPRGAAPAATNGAPPTSPQTNCRAPEAGAMTLRREAVSASGTLQLRFVGRDASYPEPAVYCVQTNAELRNADGSPRDNTTFCIWEGFVQRGRICGVAFSVQITRASDEQLTLSLRR